MHSEAIHHNCSEKQVSKRYNIRKESIPNAQYWLWDLPECFEDNVRYSGPSVTNENFTLASDANDCFYRCSNMNECSYFAFNTLNGQCYLMDRTALTGRRVNPYWTSGPRSCSTTEKGKHHIMLNYLCKKSVFNQEVSRAFHFFCRTAVKFLCNFCHQGWFKSLVSFWCKLQTWQCFYFFSSHFFDTRKNYWQSIVFLIS